MKFDQFTIVLLEHRPEAPNFDPKRASELQDAHLAYLAELHEEGYLLAAGRGTLLSSKAGCMRENVASSLSKA